jgi:hypothetical protein
MNSTCLESGDHDGITQQPPVVNWRNTGVGVGVIVGVGSGVLVGRSVGNAAIVEVAAASIGAAGAGTFAAHAANITSSITQHVSRSSRCILPPASCYFPNPAINTSVIVRSI